MPLICAGTPLLRKSSQRSDREVCDAYVAAANAAYDALVEVGTAVPPRLAQLPVQVVKGEDVSLLIVLQREMGAVAPSEVNPLSGSAIQSRICSIDATTCLIAAIRDPYSGTTVVAHFDHGGDQTEDGLVSMLNYLPAKPITTAGLLTTARRDEVEAATSANKAKRYVELYLLGAVKFDKYSAETLGSFLRNCADDQDTVFDVVLHGTCVWTQNVKPGKSGMLIHRGLMVDAKTGACSPVECDKQRAYPAGRLRALRSMDSSDRHVSGITLMPGETVSTPQPVDAPGKRRALQYVLIVRPFKFPEVGSLAARKPLSFFASMSTTPDMEPEDFAETLKSSVVYASLTTGDKVFTPHPSNPRKPSPVAFQLCVGAINASEGNAIAQDVTDDAATKSTAAEADAAPETAGEAAPAEDVAPAPAPRMAFYWYQISPARAVENL